MSIFSPRSRFRSFQARCLTFGVMLFFGLFGPTGFTEESHSSWDYPPFGADDIALFQAFQASCSSIIGRNSSKQMGNNSLFGTVGQWQTICAEGLLKGPKGINDYLAARLTKVTLGTSGEAKFTGYYKPMLQGSRTRHGAYQTPLLGRPKDLTRCNGTTGQKQPDGTCTEGYPTRHDIETNLANYKVLLWLNDPVAAYFLHIQGSGTVELDDGQTVHVGFAGKNGHPYVAIGKVLRDQGELTGTINADAIRNWLKANPTRADEILHSNPSYVFFKESKTETPGALGVNLTAGRSLAVDKSYIPLGVPLFVKSTNTFDHKPWQRIMFAHDVGSAIKGAARGDIYFGHGPLAGERAGDQNAKGTLFAMVPKENVGMQAVAKIDPNKLPLSNIEPAAQ